MEKNQKPKTFLYSSEVWFYSKHLLQGPWEETLQSHHISCSTSDSVFLQTIGFCRGLLLPAVHFQYTGHCCCSPRIKWTVVCQINHKQHVGNFRNREKDRNTHFSLHFRLATYKVADIGLLGFWAQLVLSLLLYILLILLPYTFLRLMPGGAVATMLSNALDWDWALHRVLHIRQQLYFIKWEVARNMLGK